MLTVAKVTGQLAVGYADYLQGKTTAPELGDYYLKDGERVEAAGRWVAGADRVGCRPDDVVSGDTLRELLAVRHPVTAEPLRRTGADGTAVAAIDATFSAPKSVSAVWALADRDLRARIEAAHEQAVDEAVRYAGARAAMIRERVGTTVIHAKAVDVIATAWRHTTARAVDGQAPDPQLHTHVLLHAAARRDRELVAIDSRAWLVHRRELGAAYRTQLAHHLADLGFGIDRHTGRAGRYFEIAGVPAALIDRWSSRHRQVKEAIENRIAQKEIELHAIISQGGPRASTARDRLATLQRSRMLTAAEDRLAGLSTRAAKTPTTTHDLDREWTRTARQAQFGHGDLDRLQSIGHRALPPVSADALLPALTELHATFTDREVRAITLEQCAGATIDEALAVLDQAHAAGEVLALTDGRMTTRGQRAAEQRTVAAAEQIALDADAPLPRPIVDAEIDRLETALAANGGGLTDEQRDAIDVACGEARLVVIDGQAGTGKSTVLRAVARAHQHAGQDILVTSTAALAAQRLGTELADAGVDCADYSTAGLILAARIQRVTLGPNTTVIHDEAALASTRELEPLTELVRSHGARLILVGDPEQSQPVGSGGLWPDLERIAEDTDARTQLTHNVRARDPADRRDQALFRAKDHEAALDGYQHRDRIHITDKRTAAEDAALDAAHVDRQAGRRTVVITQTSNDHLDELNARAQALRLTDGELGDQTLPLTGRPYRLRAGDHVQIRHTIQHHDHGPVRNGTTATITDIDPRAQSATLKLADGQDIALRDDQLDRAQARLAYVQHPFPAQGSTVDTTHLIIGEHVTSQGTYVGLTRARDQTDVYYAAARQESGNEHDPITNLAHRISRDERDPPSIAYPIPGTATGFPEPLPIDAGFSRDGEGTLTGQAWRTPATTGTSKERAQLVRERTDADVDWEW